MRDSEHERNFTRRLMLAWLAPIMIGADNPSPLPDDKRTPRAAAQAVAQIRSPVILRAGTTLPDVHFQVSQAKERRCAPEDAPGDVKCLLIVADVE